MDSDVTTTDEPLSAKSVLMKVLVEAEQNLEWAKQDLVWTERAYNDAQLRVKEQAQKVKTLRTLVETN